VHTGNKRGIEAVIFDLGGTLMYFDAPFPEVLAEANTALLASLKETGFQLDEQAFLQAFDDRLGAYYNERASEFIEYTTMHILSSLLADWGYTDIPAETLEPVLQGFYTVTQAHWLVEPEAVPTLQTLQQKGYRLGLVSNAGDDADVQTLVDKAGIRRYFDRILTSAAEGIRKPNPRIFQPLLDYWGITPGKVAMVGDTLGADILGARNAGLFGIWISRRADTPANRSHSDTIQPDATIASLNELPGLLDNLAPKG
jgi:HAD superfamily hydrolase (TIGR01662 family)